MRILFVTQYYYPNLAAGGPVVKIRALCEHLVSRGHSVTVVTVASEDNSFGSATPWASVEEMQEGFTIIRLRTAWRYRATTLNPAIWDVARREAQCADVVHLFGYYDLLGPVVAYFARKHRVPYVSEPMGMYVPIVRSLAKKRLYHFILGRTLMNGASRIIATSSLEKNELAQAGLPPAKVFERRNGVELSEFATMPSRGRLRRQLGIAENERVVLYFGRITPKKNPDLLMRAFARENPADSRLVLAGPGEPNYLDALKKLQAALHLGQRVIFAGPLYGEGKLSAFADADLFILPSQSENFGNSVAEAVAANVPVVITDRCGIAPYIVDRVGLVVPPDESAVGKAMSQLLVNAKLYETFRSNCPSVARELSWDQPVRAMETLYAQILAASKGRGLAAQPGRRAAAKVGSKRVLFVTQYYMPARQYGGPVVKVKGLAEALVARGHQVTVLTSAESLGTSTRRESIGGVEVVYLRAIARYRAVTINPGVWPYCEEFLRDFDLVHLFGFYDLLGPAAAFQAAKGIRPYVIEPLGMTVPLLRSLSKKRLYHWLLGKRMLGSASRIITTSEGEYKQLLDARLVARERLLLRRNGLELSEFLGAPDKNSARQMLGPDDRRLVLFLGRLAPIKSVDLLIRAFARLGLPGVRLVIAGPDDGNGYQTGLLRLVDELGLADCVEFPGPIYGEKKVALLAGADVLVLPSLFESFGNVAAEAIAAGTPVIVTEGCGVAPYVRDRVGLVSEHSEGALAAAMRQMLTTPRLYGGLKARCREVAQEFSWDQPVSQMEELYDRLVNGRAA